MMPFKTTTVLFAFAKTYLVGAIIYGLFVLYKFNQTTSGVVSERDLIDITFQALAWPKELWVLLWQGNMSEY